MRKALWFAGLSLAAALPAFGHGEQGERQRLDGGWGEIRRRDGALIKH